MPAAIGTERFLLIGVASLSHAKAIANWDPPYGCIPSAFIVGNSYTRGVTLGFSLYVVALWLNYGQPYNKLVKAY